MPTRHCRFSLPPHLLIAAALAAPTLVPAVRAADVDADRTARVRIAEARAVAARETVRLPARLAPAESVLIFARTAGYVIERRVDIGDTVKRGALLLRIAAPESARAYTAAQAAVRQQQARQALAQAEFRRAEALVASGAVSASRRDAARADLDVATATLAAVRAEAARLREIVGFTRVVAPIDGRVVERRVETGDRVSGDAAAAADYLLRIARIDELRVIVDVPQDLSLRLAVGDRATVRFAELPGETLTATLVRKADDIDAQTGTMRVELRLPNPQQRLPGGLRGEVELRPASASLVAVPMNALLIRDGQPTVAVDAGRHLHFRAVDVSHTGERDVFIRSGLAAGERVIQSPNALLREGDAIAAAP